MSSQEKLAKNVTKLLFQEDDSALKNFFLDWKKDITDPQGKKVLEQFEEKLWELRAVIFSPGNSPQPQEVEDMLKMMFLLINQGGSSMG